jgi:ribosomal protein S18 acetylase RimI-like enzyme
MSTAAPIIRPARLDEALAYTTFARAIFIATYAHAYAPDRMARHVTGAFSEATQRAELADPARTTLVAEQDGTWCGFVVLRPATLPAGGHARHPVEVERFYVDTAWHGRGLAPRLLTAALDAATQVGHDVAWLSVWRHNARAIRFYEKAGFVPAGEVTFRFGGEDELDLAFARPLT